MFLEEQYLKTKRASEPLRNSVLGPPKNIILKPFFGGIGEGAGLQQIPYGNGAARYYGLVVAIAT